MGVHARAVVAGHRLRHERRRLAEGMGDHLHHVLVDLHVVGGAHQRRVGQAELGLAGRHLVMVLVHVEAHVPHHGDHLGPEIMGGIDRRHREIAALDRRPVPDVAFLQDAPGNVRAFVGFELIDAAVHRHFEAYVVEDEELGLGPEIGDVADAGRGQVSLGLVGDRARVAVVGLAGGRLHDVADQDHRRLRRERVHGCRRRVGDQRHVGLVDRLPAGDRGAVEHDAVLERIIVDEGRTHGQVLPLAARIGEPEIDIVDLVVLELLEDVFGGLACDGHNVGSFFVSVACGRGR